MKVTRINNMYEATVCSCNPKLEEVELKDEEIFPMSLIKAIESFREYLKQQEDR